MSNLSSSEEVTQAVEEDHGVEEEQVDDYYDKLTHPFDPNKIRVTTEPKTIERLFKRINLGEIDLAPEFQRRARLWKPHRKGQLIESILLRIPLPVFYVAATEDNNWSVVDGLQRLTIIHDFKSGQFPLTGLEYLNKLEGMSFSMLPRSMRRRIEDTSLVLNIIQPGTPDEVMINIFKRLNTGGLPLKGQEIRNALYKGPARKFLASMVADGAFQRATARSVSDARMDAQECILRFSAFHLNDWHLYKRNDLDAYLGEAMRQINGIGEAGLKELSANLREAMGTAAEIFDTDAFRKRYDENGTRRPVSKALFEVWSVNLARLDARQKSLLVERKQSVKKAFMELMRTDSIFEDSISTSTGTVRKVHKRFGTIEDLIANVLKEIPSRN
ncbi:MAG: DUF262 domain-containing protein [Albidovulum sp.]|nr:DUF262 domain-containing protein [Albidovulum sp.]